MTGRTLPSRIVIASIRPVCCISIQHTGRILAITIRDGEFDLLIEVAHRFEHHAGLSETLED